MNRAIFIVGPTGTGKSDVAVELSKTIPSEIISCDSMQVYKGMDIGTGKASKEILSTAPHHLIDIIKPSEDFNVAKYIYYVQIALEKIKNHNKIPIFVGGSGLYINSIVYGLCGAPAQVPEIRARILKEQDRKGIEYLFKKLKSVDPVAASKIEGFNLRRIVRALEVFEATGIAISRYREKTESIISNYAVKMFGLTMERQKLYNRINKRVVNMFDMGLVREVKNLSQNKMSWTSSKALGYKEVIDCLKKNISLEDTISLVQRNTRRYAKRQMTWFKKNKNIKWIDVEDKASEDIANQIFSLTAGDR